MGVRDWIFTPYALWYIGLPIAVFLLCSYLEWKEDNQ